MLLASQYIQMTCAFLLAILFVTHTVKVWHILTLSFIVGLGQSFGGPAYSALLPTLVPADDLSNAIAMNSIQFNLARIIGPTIGGIAYSALGATWCFTLNGISYIAVIISLFVINVSFVPAKTQQRVLSSMGEGIRFIRQSPGMSALVLLAFCTTLFGFSLNGFLPVIVQNIFHRGPQTYTLFLVCSGAGSICGALIVASIEKVKGKDRTTLFILISLGLITIGFALSRWLPLSCILIFLAGLAIMASASMMLSLAQLSTTDAMRGRVMSVYNLAFRAGFPLGALLLGRIIPLVGISAALSGAGAILVAVSATFLFLRPDPRVA
jgi:predicted MFS family arabinose efflux permease